MRTIARAATGTWDVVCQFIVYEPHEAMRDASVFAGKIGQYVFISTASAYAKPVTRFPITEAVPLDNPYWEYSRKKIARERTLSDAKDLPLTIVRPSHTIRTHFPTAMGEGTPCCRACCAAFRSSCQATAAPSGRLTRAKDFARPFVRLFGNPAALGEAFHLTSDHAYLWDMIYAAIGNRSALNRISFTCQPTISSVSTLTGKDL